MNKLFLFRAASLAVLAATLYQVPAYSGEPIPGGAAATSFERHQIKDAKGRDITYYLSRPKSGPAPLLLMIHGSGCGRVMEQLPGGGTMYSIFNLVQYANEGRFTVLAVEKPFSGQPRQAQRGTAHACSAAFNEDFTAQSWLLALQASVSDARKQPWVDQSRTLVFGESEGAVMATMVAANDACVTDVVAISGSGTSQLYDFIVSAYRTCNFAVSACLADIENEARKITANPASATQFAWGHPYKRWTSFFAVDPAEELLRSKARVYIAMGTADTAVPALSQEIMVAKLLAANRDVTVRRVPNGDHGLMQAGATTPDDLGKEHRAAFAWFWREK